MLDRQYTRMSERNIEARSLTLVTVEKQSVLHILSVRL